MKKESVVDALYEKVANDEDARTCTDISEGRLPGGAGQLLFALSPPIR